MAPRFAPGDAVQTRFGKGVVRRLLNGNRLTVDVSGRTLVIGESELAPASLRKGSRVRDSSAGGSRHPPAEQGWRAPAAEVDLHGLTVEQALDRVQQAVSDALLADVSELRLIHGRSGGRIRAALKSLLSEMRSVRTFGLDPQNEGVTVVSL